MATVLAAGDIAIIHYNSTGADLFSFVFLRAVEIGTAVNFTDDGWLARRRLPARRRHGDLYGADRDRRRHDRHADGLDLDDAGDQIVAYQGTEASPTILHIVDLADGNNTVAGDATDTNTTRPAAGIHARRQRGRARIE